MSRAIPSRNVADFGSRSHSSRVSSRPIARYPASTSRISATNDGPRTSSDDLEVEGERADVHVARADHRDVVVDRQVLRVQDVRTRIQPDAHPGPQQVAVVRALRVPHGALVADLGDEQLHVQAAEARRRDRVDHRLVGHEVGARDDDLSLRRVHECQELTEVVLALVRRPARHDLAVERVGRGVERDLRGRHVLGLEQDLVGLRVPVREEHRVDARDDRSGRSGHEFLPLESALQVLLGVVAPVDEVLRARVADATVDHDELAVVAQVGALELALQRLDGEHEAPLRADPVELGVGRLVRRRAPGGDVVEEHAHDHAPLHGALHRREEARRRRVE